VHCPDDDVCDNNRKMRSIFLEKVRAQQIIQQASLLRQFSSLCMHGPRTFTITATWVVTTTSTAPFWMPSTCAHGPAKPGSGRRQNSKFLRGSQNRGSGVPSHHTPRIRAASGERKHGAWRRLRIRGMAFRSDLKVQARPIGRKATDFVSRRDWQQKNRTAPVPAESG